MFSKEERKEGRGFFFKEAKNGLSYSFNLQGVACKKETRGLSFPKEKSKELMLPFRPCTAQLALKRCKHFELGGDKKTKGAALVF